MAIPFTELIFFSVRNSGKKRNSFIKEKAKKSRWRFRKEPQPVILQPCCSAGLSRTRFGARPAFVIDWKCRLTISESSGRAAGTPHELAMIKEMPLYFPISNRGYTQKRLSIYHFNYKYYCPFVLIQKACPVLDTGDQKIKAVFIS
jgi:hypothetical protein